MWEGRGAFHSRFPTRVAWIDTLNVLIRENFREYLDHLLRYSVRHDEHLQLQIELLKCNHSGQQVASGFQGLPVIASRSALRMLPPCLATVEM